MLFMDHTVELFTNYNSTDMLPECLSWLYIYRLYRAILVRTTTVSSYIAEERRIPGIRYW